MLITRRGPDSADPYLEESLPDGPPIWTVSHETAEPGQSALAQNRNHKTASEFGHVLIRYLITGLRPDSWGCVITAICGSREWQLRP